MEAQLLMVRMLTLSTPLDESLSCSLCPCATQSYVPGSDSYRNQRGRENSEPFTSKLVTVLKLEKSVCVGVVVATSRLVSDTLPTKH